MVLYRLKPHLFQIFNQGTHTLKVLIAHHSMSNRSVPSHTVIIKQSKQSHSSTFHGVIEETLTEKMANHTILYIYQKLKIGKGLPEHSL